MDPKVKSKINTGIQYFINLGSLLAVATAIVVWDGRYAHAEDIYEMKLESLLSDKQTQRTLLEMQMESLEYRISKEHSDADKEKLQRRLYKCDQQMELLDKAIVDIEKELTKQ